MKIKPLSLIALFALCAIAVAKASANESAEPPNVLLILADDLGYNDLGCYGVKDFETPNLDRLAASGIRFTDGYVTAPQCGPSRAGLMTGMSQSRFGVTDNSRDFGVPSSDVVELLPEQMKAQGYATGMVGKWHIGFHNVLRGETQGYTRPGNHPWERGFDYVLKIHAGSSGYFPYESSDFRFGNGWIRPLQEKPEGVAEPVYLTDLPKDTYLTDIFTERGVDFIQRHANEPWFLYLAYTAPHGPMHAKPEKLKKYAHIENDTRRRFVAMMDSLDEGIGKVLDTLEQTGQLENTVIWFLSDNGGVAVDSWQWNGSRNNPYSGAKGDVFEGGIRIPFIVSWPAGLPKGQVVSGPVTALDILPSSLAAAGKPSVAAIHEGRNLLPWLAGSSRYPAKDLFWSWNGQYNAIRMGTLKEIRNGQNSTKAVDGTVIPPRNFVDLATNPTELAGEHALQSPEKKQMLSRRLNAWLAQVKRDAERLTPVHEDSK